MAPPRIGLPHRKFQRSSKKSLAPIDETVRKKAAHQLKLLHKEVKKAKQFEIRKVVRRIKQAKDKAGEQQDGAGTAGELQKLESQLAAARAADVDRLTAQVAAGAGVAELAAASAQRPAPAGPEGGADAAAHDAAQQVDARIAGAKCVVDFVAGVAKELERLRSQGASRLAAQERAAGDSEPAAAREDNPPPKKKAKTAAVPAADEAAHLAELLQRRAAAAQEDDSFSSGGNDSGVIDSGDDSGVIDSGDEELSSLSSGESDGGGGRVAPAQRAAGAAGQPRAEPKAKPQPKKKNRLGQRARQRLAEQTRGASAAHLQREPPPPAAPEELHPSWAAKRMQHRPVIAAGPMASKVVFRDADDVDADVTRASRAPPRRTGAPGRPRAGGAVAPQVGPPSALHPSWEEAKKRKAEQQQQIFQPKGTKIKFSDD